MNKIYMIDGYGGSPAVNWLDTEAHKLKEYFEVEKVHITDPTIANVVEWDKDLDEAIKGADEAYFICHSLGCISLLRYLARNQVSPKAVYWFLHLENLSKSFQSLMIISKELIEKSFQMMHENRVLLLVR